MYDYNERGRDSSTVWSQEISPGLCRSNSYPLAGASSDFGVNLRRLANLYILIQRKSLIIVPLAQWWELPQTHFIILPSLIHLQGSALDFYPDESQSKGCGFESHAGCWMSFVFAFQYNHFSSSICEQEQCLLRSSVIVVKVRGQPPPLIPLASWSTAAPNNFIVFHHLLIRVPSITIIRLQMLWYSDLVCSM